MNSSIKEKISENINVFSNPSELKITDIRLSNVVGKYIQRRFLKWN